MTAYTYVDGVFSGSGLNLFEHAGAAAAAHQTGLRFNNLAGISGGSVIAGAIAAGFEPGEELNSVLLSFCPIGLKLLDPEIALPSFPWSKNPKSTNLSEATPWWWPFKSHGLVKGKKLEKVLSEAFKSKGVVKFKDLKIPLKVFTTDVDQGAFVEWSTEKTPEAHLAPVIVASCRVPGIFQPAIIQGHRHVDGGVWANFPLDTFNKKDDGTDDKGEGTIGFFFGLDAKAAKGLGFMPSIINIMMASRMAEDIEDSPLAKVVTLPKGDSFDFFIGVDKATTKINAGFQAMAKWMASQ